jgi:hypothetical protein
VARVKGTSNGATFTVPAPTITSFTPTSGPDGTSITITGNNFGFPQGSNTVMINGTTATVTSWPTTVPGTSITCTVANGTTSGPLTVNMGSGTATGASFTDTSPHITSLSPTSGSAGTSVTITGTNFNAVAANNTVKFGSLTATVTSASTTQLVVTAPANVASGSVVVTTPVGASNGSTFSVPAPSISSLAPTTGLAGTSVTISGSNFGTTQGTSSVKFNGTTAAVSSWSDTSITVTAPAATNGNVVVTTGGGSSAGSPFNYVPSLTGISPSTGAQATSVVLSGANFGTSQGSSTVKFNGIAATVSAWSNTSITALVPAGAVTGSVVVTTPGGTTSGQPFTLAAPSLASLTPTSGAAGATVTIAGSNLGGVQGSSTVTVNGVAAAVTSWSNTSVVVTAPTTTSGNVIITTSGGASNALPFTFAPVITGVTPSNGPVGTLVTLDGADFGAGAGQITFSFNDPVNGPSTGSFAANSWSDTQVIFDTTGFTQSVGLSSGTVVTFGLTSAGGLASNPQTFTVP